MKVVSILSPKGGVGKSTIALMLAGGLSYQGKKVTICDMDQEGSCLEFKMFAKDTLPFEIISGFPTGKPNLDKPEPKRFF